ncbi:MAG: dockerin type I domain-containing protein [Limisphaerales bacterium]
MTAGISPIVGNLTLSGSATATTVEATTVGGNLGIGDGTTFTAAGYALTVNGTTTVGGGTSGTLSISSATGTKTFTGAVTINSGGALTESAAAALSFGSAVTINGTLTESGTLGGAGTITMGGTGVLNIGASSVTSTLAATATGNTVNYNASAAQTVKATTYYNLIFSGTSAKSMATGTSVTGDLSIAPTGTATASVGTGLDLSVGTLTLGGVTQVPGTWGSTSSSATHQNNTYFAATSGYLTVGSGATKLAYTTVPSTGTAGTAFSVTVQSQDAYGNPANLSSATTITLSKASGGGTLSGTLTGSIASGADSVTISGVVYSMSDTMTLTATASGGVTLTAVTSGNIVFSAGAATKLAYTTVPTTGTAGTPFSVTVQSQDANGNPSSPTSTTTITLSKATGGGTLSGTLTGTIPTSGNSVTISTPVYSKADTMTLTATATVGETSLTAVTSGNIVFSAGAATKLAYTMVPSTGTAGTAFSVTVQSQDAYGNPASPTSSTTITLSKASGGGTLSGTLTGIIPTSGNSVPISGIVYSKPDTMTLTATATAGETGLSPITSGNIVFSGGTTTPTITGVVNQTNAFGTATLTLTGTVSTATEYPPLNESGTISATINGLKVTGTFTNGSGAFVIYIDDPALASDGVSGSPYTITYAYAGDDTLTAAADNTDTTLTVLPALTSTSSTANLDGFAAATVPVAYITSDSTGATYSNVVQVAGVSDGTFTITLGVPPGTTSVRLKPRFYLSKVFTADKLTFNGDGNTGTIDLGGVTFLGGDANGDDKVDGTDYAWLRYWWGYTYDAWSSYVGSNLAYDINGDGVIDANDFPDFGGYGVIGAADYLILEDGWYQTGDSE